MADDKHGTLMTLRESIAADIADLAESRTAQVKEMMVEAILDKQCDIIVPGIEMLQKLENEFKRFKPTEFFDDNGQVSRREWTKEGKDAKDKAHEQIEKLRRLLNKAIEEGDINDLQQFIKSRSDKKGGGGDSQD